MHSHLTEWALKIQGIAQAGLTYGKDAYDIERYQELMEIAAEMIASQSDATPDVVQKFVFNDPGYLTPKVETRAAIFKDGKILLVHEKDGTWAMPGGWCDVDQGVGSNAVKETREETGLEVVANRLIAVQDWRKHNIPDLPCALIRNFVLCKVIGGSFVPNIETSEARYFGKDELPENLAPHKCTVEQINMCFDANEAGDSWKTLFD